MIGGIVHALSKGSSMREALQWGIAAGAAAVITPGTELCRREDVDRLYNEVVDRNG
jgi:6-phosphofructokinase 2